MPLSIRLCWEAGWVPAHADEQAAAPLLRRAGLPRWIEVGGVIYRPVWGVEAQRIREELDRTPRVE